MGSFVGIQLVAARRETTQLVAKGSSARGLLSLTLRGSPQFRLKSKPTEWTMRRENGGSNSLLSRRLHQFSDMNNIHVVF